MFLKHNLATAVLCVICVRKAEHTSYNCRERSNHFRQDGGLCFEIAPWQHQYVEVEHHLYQLREVWGSTPPANSSIGYRTTRAPKLALMNSEVKRYMDTVIAPFLETYHRNIQNFYHQFATKILRRAKDEMHAAIKRKQQVYTELTELADKLKVPAVCNEERRAARTVASSHVAQIYRCNEEARASLVKMARYADGMISITRSHMQRALSEATKSFTTGGFGEVQKENVTVCLKELSGAAVALGYELDLSLTNARRHNEQSCEKLSSCNTRARKSTEEAVATLRDQLYQCVYA